MSIIKLKGKTVIRAAGLIAVVTTGLLLIGSGAALAGGVPVEAGMSIVEVPIEGQTPADMMTSESVIVPVNLTDEAGVGEEVGTVTLEDTQYGLLLTPSLMGLAPGIHGFHVHQNSACGPSKKNGEVVPGLAAGGHYDPANTDSHEGPYGEGHLGDLPPLYVDMDGDASTPVLAPRLTAADVVGHSLMIHMDGDNFSDMPAPLGGGGARLACGVIE